MQFDFMILMVFLYTRRFTYKVQINYAIYDYMDTSIEDIVIVSHN